MPRSVDVVVIGGGVVGLCSARSLRERGFEVMVLERDDVSTGCSVGNAGLVVPSHVVPLAAPGVVAQGLRWLLQRESPFRIRPQFRLSLLRWLWTFYRSCTHDHVEESMPVLRDLSRASRSLYEEFAGRMNGRDFGFRSSGLLMLHNSKKGREKVRKHADRAGRMGLQVDVMDRRDIGKRGSHLPEGVNGGAFYPEDAMLRPGQLVDVLHEELENNGATIQQGVAATGFARENGTVRAVETTEGFVRADTFVVAAGAWSTPLVRTLNLDLPVEPAKGYSVTVSPTNGTPTVPFILTEDKVSVTPIGDRLRIAGTLELSGFDSSVDHRRIRPILEMAASYGADVNPDAPESVDVWSGFRPCTPDGLPVIGPASEYDNLVLATGHCMLGVSLGPITGQLVAEVIMGETPAQELGPFRLDRFH